MRRPPPVRRLAAALPLITLCLIAGSVSSEKLPPPVKKALDTIVERDVRKYVEYLTSDECAGRDTPQPGLDVAAAYLAKMYKSFGLEGAGPEGSFLQKFDVSAMTYDAEDYLAVSHGDEEELKLFEVGKDFVPIRGSVSGAAEGELVFAGYGIEDSNERYDDFRGVSVKDRIVVVLTHEPREGRKGRAFKGLKWTDHGRIDWKARAAQERGAKAVIVLTDPINHEDLSVLKAEMPRAGASQRRRRGGRAEIKIPLVHASGEVAEALIGVKKLREWQKRIDKKLKGAPQLLEGVQARVQVTVEQGNVKAANVVAMKRGTDPKLKDEWIIVGAHYDHIGADPFGRIFRGADDNGSGTSCLLEVAEALASPDVELRRSVLFISFAGEERGLKGANAYCANPLFPTGKTVTMINVDMIGRGRSRDIDAVGLSYSRDLSSLTKSAISLTKTKIRVGKEGLQYFKRSDQLPFWEAGIPVLFFMEPDEHSDYHKVTDTADKLDYRKITLVGRVISGLVFLLADSDERPQAKTGARE